MARLYANENFPLPTVAALRNLGHDVVTIHDTGRANVAMSDSDVLRAAFAEGRALLTMNRRHFVRLHLDGIEHAGIVACKVDADFVMLAERIHRALQSRESFFGSVIRVTRENEKPML